MSHKTNQDVENVTFSFNDTLYKVSIHFNMNAPDEETDFNENNS